MPMLAYMKLTHLLAVCLSVRSFDLWGPGTSGLQSVHMSLMLRANVSLQF